MNQQQQLSFREVQLQEYRFQQEQLGKQFKTYSSNTPVVSLQSLQMKAKTLVDNITALNIVNLNVGAGSSTNASNLQHLNQKVSELYNVLKEIREDNKFTANIL